MNKQSPGGHPDATLSANLHTAHLVPQHMEKGCLAVSISRRNDAAAEPRLFDSLVYTDIP